MVGDINISEILKKIHHHFEFKNIYFFSFDFLTHDILI
jgi:hypothetical protein